MFILRSEDYEHELESGTWCGESWLWVNLTCGQVTRAACYERDDQGTWAFLDGEDEPPMPDDLRGGFASTPERALLRLNEHISARHTLAELRKAATGWKNA